MDFQSLWLTAKSEKKDPSDPQVPHVFSATDMPIARYGTSLTSSDTEDAEYILLACEAASHTHYIDLLNVGGHPDRDNRLQFPAFEKCCQHPMLSHADDRTVSLMRQRCKADTIMTASFKNNVSPTGRFLITDKGLPRIVGTNIEEDRILYVTCESGRIKQNSSFSGDEYKGNLHRMVLNTFEDIKRRLSGFQHVRCDNVSRSAVLALLKVGEAMVDAVDNLVTAVRSGAPDDEIVWQQDGCIVKVEDMKRLEGFDDDGDYEHSIDPLAELLLNAANREIIFARAGCPPPINLLVEPNCNERRLFDYFKQILLNNKSEPTLYAMRAATIEALVQISGLRATLLQLCTSSLAAFLTAQNSEDYYNAMKLQNLLGLSWEQLNYLSGPITANGNDKRTRRTRQIIDSACTRVWEARPPVVVKYEEVMHDPEILHLEYNTGDLELDLLRISDHVISCSKLINHDTEIRMLNLLAIGSEMIQKELEEEDSAQFFGITVRNSGENQIRVESADDVRIGMANLKALRNHIDVFSCMLCFMVTGPTAGCVGHESSDKCVPDRSIFVSNCFKRLKAEGLTRSEALETAVMAAKVFAVRRSEDYKRNIIVEKRTKDILERVRGCILELETRIDVADVVCLEHESDMDHFGADSTVLEPVEIMSLSGGGFKLIDYMQHCKRYGRLDIFEDAVPFNAEGQKYFAYCRDGRVFARKRGVLEKPRRYLGGSKIGLTVLGTGLVIELKEKNPKKCDAEAMDLIMNRAKQDSTLGFWVWSKILKGHIKYRETNDSCMWNEYAASDDARVVGRWSVPKWVLKYMLVMVEDDRTMSVQPLHRYNILVQGGDDMPMLRLKDTGSTRYDCTHVDSKEVKRDRFRKAFFEPDMSCGGSQHPRRVCHLPQ